MHASDDASFPRGEWTGRIFQTTHWSAVLRVSDERPGESRQALEELCRTYWYPLYAFVRRKGCNHEEAQDLTQTFFAKLLEKNRLSLADPERGRFRTFLLRSFENFRELAVVHLSGGSLLQESVEHISCHRLPMLQRVEQGVQAALREQMAGTSPEGRIPFPRTADLARWGTWVPQGLMV